MKRSEKSKLNFVQYKIAIMMYPVRSILTIMLRRGAQGITSNCTVEYYEIPVIFVPIYKYQVDKIINTDLWLRGEIYLSITKAFIIYVYI